MPPRERAHALPKTYRIGGEGAFGPVLRSGIKMRGEHLVVHAVPGTSEGSRIGIAVSRRNLPSAVRRNRVKRIVREAFRRHPLKVSGMDCVVVLRQRIEPSAMGLLRDEVTGLFDRLQATER